MQTFLSYAFVPRKSSNFYKAKQAQFPLAALQQKPNVPSYEHPDDSVGPDPNPGNVAV